MDKNEPIISFNKVYLSFDKNEVLKDLSFDIYKEEIVSIVGPSGCGKSTILKLITGLLYPDAGEIVVNTKSLGMAFQYAALFNSMTVWENIALALKENTKFSYEMIDERVKESLKIVGLEHTEEMMPNELSGGMQKRLSIARALALKPDIILYDEPSTGLDPVTALKLEEDMVRLRDEIGLTSIVVTHDIDTIQKVSDRVMILDQGKIIWSNTLDVFLSEGSIYPCKFRTRRCTGFCKYNNCDFDNDTEGK